MEARYQVDFSYFPSLLKKKIFDKVEKIIGNLVGLSSPKEGLIHTQFIVDKNPSINATPFIDSQALCTVAANTKRYLEQYSNDDFAVHKGAVIGHDISLAKVKATLDFICKIHRQDQQNKQTKLS